MVQQIDSEGALKARAAEDDTKTIENFFHEVFALIQSGATADRPGQVNVIDPQYTQEHRLKLGSTKEVVSKYIEILQWMFSTSLPGSSDLTTEQVSQIAQGVSDQVDAIMLIEDQDERDDAWRSFYVVLFNALNNVEAPLHNLIQIQLQKIFGEVLTPLIDGFHIDQQSEIAGLHSRSFLLKTQELFAKIREKLTLLPVGVITSDQVESLLVAVSAAINNTVVDVVIWDHSIEQPQTMKSVQFKDARTGVEVIDIFAMWETLGGHDVRGNEVITEYFDKLPDGSSLPSINSNVERIAFMTAVLQAVDELTPLKNSLTA